MSIKKYSSFEEAAKDLWVFEPDDKYFQNLKANFEFWSKISKHKTKKGIQKFKDFNEFVKVKQRFE